MDVATILAAAQSADAATRQDAEARLTQAEQLNFPLFLTTLTTQLSTEGSPVNARRLAGLIIKNSLDAQDAALRVARAERWVSVVDAESQKVVRDALLATLSSPEQAARRAAAQAIAKIAAIDLPMNAWPGLLDKLMANSTSARTSGVLKTASLETIGFVCEEAATREASAVSAVLSTQSNLILTAVVHGMKYTGAPANGDPATPADASSAEAREVRLAATVALNNALEFVRTNFETAEHRRVIMQTTVEAARDPDASIRVAAFECLVRVAEEFYDILPESINDLFQLAMAEISGDDEPVALQAIELWSTIAEEEIALEDEAAAATEVGEANTLTRRSHAFVSHALAHLCPALFQCLTQQEDDCHEENAWNRATAAGSCLELLAQAAPARILEYVVPFVRDNVAGADWRAREAAVLAFGSVLDGPPQAQLAPVVAAALPVLVRTLVEDVNAAVRDTTAWTIGRVLRDGDHKLAAAAILPDLVSALWRTLKDENAPVAAHVCYAIHNLADAFSADGADEEDDSGATTNGTATGLADYAEGLLRELFITTERSDGGEAHLRVSAYEAISAIFRAVGDSSLNCVTHSVPLLLDRLEASLSVAAPPPGTEAAAELAETQGLLCGALTTATQRLRSMGVGPFTDRMLQCYMKLLEGTVTAPAAAAGGATNGVPTPNSNAVHEEALLAIEAVADALGPDFSRYFATVAPVLVSALRNWTHYQLCAVAVGTVGDICRAIGKDFATVENGAIAREIVRCLLDAVQSQMLDKSVKPAVLSAFGDVAMAIKGDFEPFLGYVMQMMQEAASTSMTFKVPDDDYDLLDWLLALRESVFEAYTGVIHGLKDDGKQALLETHVEWLLIFCEAVHEDETMGAASPPAAEALSKAALGVLGDLVEAAPALRPKLSGLKWLRQSVENSEMASDMRTRQTAAWAKQVIFAPQ